VSRLRDVVRNRLEGFFIIVTLIFQVLALWVIGSVLGTLLLFLVIPIFPGWRDLTAGERFGYAMAVSVFLVGPIIGAGLYRAWDSWGRSEMRRRRAEAAYRAGEPERQRAAELAQRNERIKIAQSVLEIPSQVVAAYRQAGAFLAQSSGWVADAEQLYHRRAYSRFWAAVEGGTFALNQFQDRLSHAHRIAEQYPNRVAEVTATLHEMGTEPPLLPPELGGAEIARVGHNLEGRLQAVVERAETDPVFAQIFEQRRTTAAVQQLSTSLWDIGAKMSEANQRLCTSVASGNAEIQRLTERVGWQLDPDSSSGTLGSEVRAINVSIQRLSA